MQCDACAAPIRRQVRVYRRSRFPDHCRSCAASGGAQARSGKCNACPDCGVAIWRGSSKCKSCAQKTLQQRHCCDCGVAISLRARERCIGCHNKKQNRGLSRARTLFNVSTEWREARLQCFSRDDFQCQQCGDRGGVLHAHHIVPYAKSKELRLDVTNLLTLCKPCHDDLHGLTKKNIDPKARQRAGFFIGDSNAVSDGCRFAEAA